MAEAYSAIYKRYNGTDWDTFYFATLATQVSETANRKFLTSAQQDYFTNVGVEGGVALLGAGAVFAASVIPDLSATYLKKASPTFTGTLTGGSTGKAVLPGGVWKEAAAENGINFNGVTMEFKVNNVLNAVLADGGFDMQGGRVVGLGTPTDNAHAATKQYVDNLISSGVKPITSVKAVSTNTTIPSGTVLEPDGVVVSSGNRVLLIGLTVVADRGIYLVSAGVWTKVPADSTTGALVFVENGATWNDHIFYCSDASTGNWIIHSRMDTYKAASGGGLEKNTSNEFSISASGVTNTMLAGSIAWSKIANSAFYDNANAAYDSWGELANAGTAASLLEAISTAFGAIGLLRGTATYNAVNTETIAGAYTLANTKIVSLIGTTDPVTTNRNTGDLYFQYTV